MNTMRMRLTAMIVLLLAAGEADAATPKALPQPYKGNVTNFAYNLLFCDTPQLFAQNASLPPASPLSQVLHAADGDAAKVRKIADDDHGDSCTRMLAYDWLRAHKQPVPPKVFLGVVAEMGTTTGPNVTAAYADGNIRFISNTEKLASFGASNAEIAAQARTLVTDARAMLPHLDPWKEPRVPAAPWSIIRITILASDGLHFGDGEIRHMARDKFGGQTVLAALELLRLGYQATNPGKPATPGKPGKPGK
jgi:hypothetical protein